MMNIRAENVAEHTWGVVHLLFMVFPDTPLNLIVATQYHDFGEAATGDMPGNVRWANPAINDTLEAMEAEHNQKHLPGWIWTHMSGLNEADKLLIEVLDRAEFCMSQSRERRLGNTYAMIYMNRSFNRMMQKWQELEPLVYEEFGSEVHVNLTDLLREITIEIKQLEGL